MAISDEAIDQPQGEGLFVRKSSGLVRDVGLRDAFGINAGILCMIYDIIVLAIFQVSFPNTDYYIPLLAGAVISLVLCLAYSQLVATFARAGGEYIYATRVFSPILGATVGGALIVGITLAGAFTVIGIAQVGVPLMFTAIGRALGSHSLVTFGSSTLIAKTPYLIVSLIVLGFFAVVSLRPMASIARWIFWCFCGGAVAFVILLMLLVFESHAGFVTDFNKASGGANAYSEIITHAKAGGLHVGSTLSGAVLAIPVGFLFFQGFTFANYAAGELKRPARTYKLSVLAALFWGLAGGVAVWAALRHSVGLHFMQASGALNPTEYAKLTSVQQNQGGVAYALLASGDPVTKIIIGLGTVMALLANGLAYFILVSRIVFALSFDRLLPTKMSDVSKRTHSPVYAVALIALIILAFSVLGDETTLLSVARNFLLILTAIFAIGSAAAAALPYRCKDLYESSPKAFRGHIFGVPVVTLLGTLAAMACVYVDVVLATHTAYSGGYSTSSILLLVVVVLLGPTMYATSRWRLSRKGIDLRMALRELPPE